MSNEDKEFIKSRLKDSAFTSFWSYNHNNKINLTENERLALTHYSPVLLFYTPWKHQKT